MIVAPLEMVSPMFIALLVVWSQVLVGAAASSLNVHVKVCHAHTDKAEIKCMGSVVGKHQ